MFPCRLMWSTCARLAAALLLLLLLCCCPPLLLSVGVWGGGVFDCAWVMFGTHIYAIDVRAFIPTTNNYVYARAHISGDMNTSQPQQQRAIDGPPRQRQHHKYQPTTTRTPWTPAHGRQWRSVACFVACFLTHWLTHARISSPNLTLFYAESGFLASKKYVP